MNTYNRYMGIDVVALEAERFGLTAERARKIASSMARKRWRENAKARTLNATAIIANIQPKVQTVVDGVNLTEAQSRAYNKYLEGIRNGNSDDV